MAENEKVHPLVSNLLEQVFVPRIAGEVFRYDRDEMMRLKTVPLSVTRPDNLSVEFDGEDGKFSPFKWLEHRWEVEGIKNRPTNKKLQDALRADCDENAGLSPQRRGFSSGCRAPTEEKKEREVNSLVSKDDGWSTVDSAKERLFAASSSKWRPASTSSEKFNSAKGNEFKLPFQRSTAVVDKSAKGAGWKTIEGKERQSGSFSTTGKFIPARSYRGTDERGEKIPEWADDPTTMDDMIELRGFEEPTKKKKGAKTDNKSKSGTNSRSSPAPLSKEKTGSDKALLESLRMTAETTPIPLPDTDAELAAILGLMDLPPGLPNPSGLNAATASTISGLSGSRMSKFFNKGAASTDSSAQSVKEGRTQLSVTEEMSSNPMLAKLFSHNSTGRGSPQNINKNNQNVRPLRLEDLERNFTPARNEDLLQKQTQGDDIAKGNLLQDPQQQAQLLQKLHKVARQQEEGQSSASPPLQRHTAQPGIPPNTSSFPIPGMVPQIPPEHILVAHAQHLLAMQLQQAYPGGVPQIAPPILERMRNDLIRNIIARHQQLQSIMANANLQQHAAAAVQQAKTVRPAMIPASVQRQMSKAVVVEEKRDKESEEDSAMRQQAEIFKKQQMQQQYSVLMNAMQNGLPMAAIRQGTVPVGQSPNPQQLQAIMAAQAQAQQLHRMAYMQKQQQQQQAAMMKLVAIQQQQQIQHNGETERTPTAPAGNGNDMLQVGPIQTPLEKLLTAAGVQPSQFNGSTDQTSRMMGTSNFAGARPMSLEELERNISNTVPSLPSTVRPMSLEELERHLTEKSNKLT